MKRKEKTLAQGIHDETPSFGIVSVYDVCYRSAVKLPSRKRKGNYTALECGVNLKKLQLKIRRSQMYGISALTTHRNSYGPAVTPAIKEPSPVEASEFVLLTYGCL